VIDSWTIIHQTGEVSFDRANEYKKNLGEKGDRYIIQPFFDISDLSWIYAHAEIILGRSGANTVAELSALHKKAIFVPLPWAGGDEQKMNADRYALTGNAMVIEQKHVSEQSLNQAIETLKFQKSIHQNETLTDAKTSAQRLMNVIDAL